MMIHKYIIDKEDLPKLIKGEELPLSQGSKARAFMIEITGNLTNGDMIKALFPNIKWWINTDRQIFAESGTLNLDWWNKPYKKGVDK